MRIGRVGRAHRPHHLLRAPRLGWGGLRRTAPLVDAWSRGTPVDRPAIDRFFARHAARLTGDVLEVQAPVYTDAVGTGVRSRSVLDLVDGPGVTHVADLSVPGSLPTAAFDCVVLPQTLQFVDDPAAAVANAAASLRPGGALLVTVPMISRVRPRRGDGPVFDDLWRWTPAGLARLLRSGFPADGDTVVTEGMGSVLSCVAFLHGLGAGELTAAELAVDDPSFPLVVGGVAVRAA